MKLGVKLFLVHLFSGNDLLQDGVVNTFDEGNLATLNSFGFGLEADFHFLFTVVSEIDGIKLSLLVFQFNKTS